VIQCHAKSLAAHAVSVAALERGLRGLAIRTGQPFPGKTYESAG